MHKLDPIETILARMMPPALSAEGQRGIEDMLDELAGPLPEILPVKPWFRRPWVGAGAAAGAAAGIAAAILLPLALPRLWTTTAPLPAVALEQEATDGVVLVGESGRIKSMSMQGWQENPDGTALRTLRMRVVEENQFLDEETGIIMLVSEPREEYLLMPVSAF
jgi:hypothetical protein